MRSLFYPLLSWVPGTLFWRRSRERQVMRGNRKLQEEGKHDAVARVKQALTVCNLRLQPDDFSTSIMGAGLSDANALLRQYLLLRIGGINFNRALLAASERPGKRVVFPMPSIWQKEIIKHGFDVDCYRSTLLWYLYSFALLGYGILKICGMVFEGFVKSRPAFVERRPYAYFSDLSKGNLPNRSGSNHYNVVTWYLGWQDRCRAVEEIRHSVDVMENFVLHQTPVIRQRGALPSGLRLVEVIKLSFWGLYSSTLSTFDLLRGRWWHAVILNQAALAAKARITPANDLAAEYLFHNSNAIYRPLWTYEAEAKGSSLLYFFYSTNNQAFKFDQLYPPLMYGWAGLNWPRYLVWDQYQADFVYRMSKGRTPPKIDVVGCISFEDSGKVPDCLVDKDFIAVFDVQPKRVSVYRSLALSFDYYNPIVSSGFLRDVSDVAKKHSKSIAWKMKRNIGNQSHPLFRRIGDELMSHEHVVAVDPEVAAARLIQDSWVVISMPFTSTAVIAKELGKPSAYYDPTGRIDPNDRAAHGVRVLRGKYELDEWVFKQLEVRKGQSRMARV